MIGIVSMVRTVLILTSVVVTVTGAMSAASASRPNSASTLPTEARSRCLVVYPLGDSITRGIDNIGYRMDLYEALGGAGIDAEFVGSLSHGPKSFPQPRHEGRNGWTLARLTSRIDGWLAKFDPDVILLMAGANDIEAWFPKWKTMPNRLAFLIDRIHELRPHAILFVSEVTPIRNDRFDAQVLKFNSQIKALVEERAQRGRPIVFVPMYDAITKDDLLDLDHPSPEGNRKIALRWARLIQQNLPAASESFRD